MLSSTVIEPDLSTIIPVVGLDIVFLIAHLCVVRSVWHWLNVVGHFDFVYVPVDCKHFANHSFRTFSKMFLAVCQDVFSFVVSPCPELDCKFVFPAEVVDAKTSLESHLLQCTFKSTEVSAVPAEVVDAKTSVEGSPVAAHIFTSQAGPMD